MLSRELRPFWSLLCPLKGARRVPVFHGLRLAHLRSEGIESFQWKSTCSCIAKAHPTEGAKCEVEAISLRAWHERFARHDVSGRAVSSSPGAAGRRDGRSCLQQEQASPAGRCCAPLSPLRQAA